MEFKDATSEEIQEAVNRSWQAFAVFRKTTLRQRADFMRSIAAQLSSDSDRIIHQAMGETNLPELRLRGELTRTIFQLNSYGEAAERGDWLEARIDTANPDKVPAKPDLRKQKVPLGPVVVFGASNFPFAYSTAGGDTACALAAGCPVLVKAHPAHAATSELVAKAILDAAERTGMPEGVFAHIHGIGFEPAKLLVTHPRVKAVGFTGSFAGGKALFDLAAQRPEPIPVFAEMGSINPVFLLPEKLQSSATEVATLYAGSITLSVGQFCTNPGLLIGLAGGDLDRFIEALATAISQVAPAKMLHAGIAKSFHQKRSLALSQADVKEVSLTARLSAMDDRSSALLAAPTIASTSGRAFLANPILHQEVFGPYSLVVGCSSVNEMIEVAQKMEGQLTTTLMASDREVSEHPELIEAIQNICGRVIFNGVPTGVEVCLSMQHGGPFPATTDSRFTSVGADGISRFTRAICFQNWPDALLPAGLQNSNPLGIWRTINNQLTKHPVG
jgi:NADP-dependent aldehyde dehydrogenase